MKLLLSVFEQHLRPKETSISVRFFFYYGTAKDLEQQYTNTLDAILVNTHSDIWK